MNSYPVFFPVSFTPFPLPPAACYRKPSLFAMPLDSKVLKWQEAGRACLLFCLYCQREPCRFFQASASLYRQGCIKRYDRSLITPLQGDFKAPCNGQDNETNSATCQTRVGGKNEENMAARGQCQFTHQQNSSQA